MIPSASQPRPYFHQSSQNFSQFSGRNLITAVRRGHLHDARKLLLDTRALTYVDADGCSPLHQAAHNGSLDIIEALLAQMQLKGISVDIENQDQTTPLMNAISAGRLAVVIRLLEAGAHVNHVDKRLGTRPCIVQLLRGLIKSSKYCLTALFTLSLAIFGHEKKLNTKTQRHKDTKRFA